MVYFRSAGVSYPAGLPGLKGSVDEIYPRNCTATSDIARAALDLSQHDATLDLVERRLPGQRFAVCRELAGARKPKLRRRSATDTYRATVGLARRKA